MKRIIERIRNSEFLTFSEVLRLKVSIVTLFLSAMIILSIVTSPFNNLSLQSNVFVPMALGLMILLTILLMVVNVNRLAMHVSSITIIVLTIYYSQGSDHFYGYIMFFVALTVIIFYQDILAYLFYGGFVSALGVYYIFEKSSTILGVQSINPVISQITYLIILIGFFLVFMIQFLISDHIYEKMNNEWVRMNKILKKYQEFSLGHLKEMVEEKDETLMWANPKFQQVVNELSVFINEFFEQDAQKISETVEYYFFLHSQEIEEIVDNKNASVIAKRYALQFERYLMNKQSELTSILFDFATMFKPTDNYEANRYNYNLDSLLHDRIDKLLSLAILYHYLKNEITQFDKWRNIKNKLTHEEITEMFTSKEFREFISYEQVNFYIDNEELFKNNL